MNYDDYPQLWKTIDSLENQGLVRSALEQVETLLAKAKGEQNAPQIYKALMYKSKFASQLEEEGFAKAILELEIEAAQLQGPAKAILQSQLGQLFETYLSQNYWTIKDRTSTGELKGADIQTWTADQLLGRAQELYLASIADKSLQRLAASDFEAILTPAAPGTETLRPTLYDVLVHRCIEFLNNDRSFLNEPANRFYLDQAAAFAPVETFVETTFEAADSKALKYQAVLVYQELLRFRLKANDKTALLDADRFRLEFAQQNSVHPEKEQLYLDALQAGKGYYAGATNVADLWALEAAYYFERGGQYNREADVDGTDPLRWYYQKTLELAQQVIKDFPKDAWGVQKSRQLLQQIEVRDFSVQVEEVTLPFKAGLIQVVYRNTPKVHFKLVRMNEDRIEELQQVPQHKDDALRKFLKKLPSQRQWTVELPKETDYRDHSTETLIEPQEAGTYLLIASDVENFAKGGNAGYVLFNVSNLGYWNRMDSDERQQFVVYDRTTGSPKVGVKAELWHRTYNSVRRNYVYQLSQSTETDAKGFIHTDEVSDRLYFRLKLMDGKDTLYLGSGYPSHYQQYNRNAQVYTHFFTDRAIYRPGQTVYYKGMLLEKDPEMMPKILPYEEVTVTFLDVNYQEVGKQKLKTNAYGTFSGTFIAPTSGLLGMMRLNSSRGGQQTLRVEEYKRPKFEVDFPQLEEAFSLDEEVRVKGFAKAYAGNAIDGATVKYRVLRQARFPWLPWWYFRGYNPWSSISMEIAQGTVQTDANGEFIIPFVALPDRSIPEDKLPEFNYTVFADVTDISGETQTGQTYVNIGYIALRAQITTPETMHADSFKHISIETTNLNGGFEAASGTVEVSLLKAPEQLFVDRKWDAPDHYLLKKEDYRKFFPHIAFGKEDQAQNWPVDRVVLEDGFDTGAAGQVRFGKVKIVPGLYMVRLNTMDKAGKAVSLEKLITVYAFDAELPVKTVGWTHQPARSYEPGETAQLYAGSSLKDQPMLFEMERNGQLLYSKWIKRNELESLEYQVEEADRGNVHYHLSYAAHNRSYHNNGTFTVPWTNKMLQIEYVSFRDKLLPGQDEEWQIKLKGPKSEKVAAEMVAAMYDASLDAFAPNNWYFNVFPGNYAKRAWRANGDNALNLNRYEYLRQDYIGVDQRNYAQLQAFGFNGYSSVFFRDKDMMVTSASPRGIMRDADGAAPPPPPAAEAAPAEYSAEVTESVTAPKSSLPTPEPQSTPAAGGAEKLDDIPVRTNLNETVFFYPHLATDEEGNILIKFKMNEALTRWKFQSFAHTKELAGVLSTKEIVTQKDLMVVPNPPRFYRENDEIEFTSKVVNMTSEALTGNAVLQLVNPLNDKPVYDWKTGKDYERTFVIEGEQSVVLSWRFKIPDLAEVPVIQHTVLASAGKHSDAERAAAPVVSNRMLVTETMPMPLKGKETKTFEMERLTQVKSPTLSHQSITLEFTSNPAWYAVQALPYLMEYPYECTEQIFSRYYANTLATSVANAHPKIKTVFDQWRGTDALESNLMKNQELKSALLAETPWVLNAQSESDQKKQIALLFDLNRMAQEQAEALKKLADRQLPGGGFAWFPGGRDSWYITQYLVEGLGHLHQLGVADIQGNPTTWRMVRDAVQYIDNRMIEYYEQLEDQVKRGLTTWDENHLSDLAVHYLYTRSYFLQDRSAQANRGNSLNPSMDPQYLPLDGKIEKVVQYFLTQSQLYWTKKGIYPQGMISLYAKRLNKLPLAQSVVKSLAERALHHDELGMYWKYPNGYFWNELPLETHALMIEVFEEVAADKDAVYELKVWLLKNKQTNHWKTTKATASAVYALLRSGDNWLLEDQPLEIGLGKRKDELAANWEARILQAQSQAEAGTGYFKTSFGPAEIDQSMGKVTVKNPNSTIAWGGLYWQYFEQLDKITTFEETPLELKKQLFRVDLNDRGEVLTPLAEGAQLKPGDKLMVRIELRVDRPMEYVHMKDMRASGFEPINVLSRYKWQGGLGYYESTRDVSTNFFFSYLPTGTHVFEYPLRVVHKGDFSNGITTIQCMYAPEYTSHSEGIRVAVE